MATGISRLLQIVLPKRRGNDKGTAYSNTFNPSQAGQAIPAPRYRDHLRDLTTERTTRNSVDLIKDLAYLDTDLSATINAYLTTADTQPMFVVRDLDGNIDRNGQKVLEGLRVMLTRRFDYSKGYVHKQSLREICEGLRFMLLVRGGIAAELVLDKVFAPIEIRNVDMATLTWFEDTPGWYRPVQKPKSSGDEIDLNIPTFFTSWFRRDPTSIYPMPPFVAAINTIMARQQVINDLYRIMQMTGYPRIDVKVVEEVLRKNAPAYAQEDESKMREWINTRISEIQNAISSLRPDEAFVHVDAVEPDILNRDGPGKSLDASAIIEVLNAQNQAGLKVMSTIIGRGESGVNTASVEASIFAKNAEALNGPVADILSQMLTLLVRLHGVNGWVDVSFKKVDLRPEMELENHQTMRQARHLELLSHGIISDDDFHMAMFNRIRPDSVPELTGTGFYDKKPNVDVEKTSPNSDPQGRSITPEGGKQARSNSVKK